ncbi:MAG: Gfo/Idh/MocA family oxidoreductase [Phycisphaerales bacterium]|nr:Gfo/Idh/MocA family oxidoreductase [Phycisphaerales bacterium]
MIAQPGRTRPRRIRYAVAGLGYIAQAAALPAFRNARRNSEVVALFSHDARKLRELGARYGVTSLHPYDDYDEVLRSGGIDAVYIALPNSMHAEFTVRAALAGVHVLCEKPMAVAEADCAAMVRACRRARVRLMIAYRLHLEETTLRVLEICRSGRIGDVRAFNSVFTMQVRDRDNIRLDPGLGGGPVYDIGTYCINAARMVFNAEPEEVFAAAPPSRDSRFRDVPELVSCVLRYPGGRVATFTVSFGASPVSEYRIVGTKGDVRVSPAYEYARGLAYEITVDGITKRYSSRKGDQFAAELLYFSGCILEDRNPEPSGEEGLADVRIICALRRSAQVNRPISVGGKPDPAPRKDQGVSRPGVRRPRLVHVEGPTGDR